MVAQKNLIKKITPEVLRFIHVLNKDKVPLERIYVYGSYAKGNPHKYSDIDVCVISPQFKNNFDSTSYLFRISGALHSDIEPVAFSPEDFIDENPLVWEIKQHGIEIPIKGLEKKLEVKKKTTKKGQRDS